MSSIFVIITGSSKGIGRSCAIAFANNLSCKIGFKKLHLCLLARSVDGLAETSRLVKTATATATDTICETDDDDKKKVEVEISTHPIDLSDLESLQEKIQNILMPTSTQCIHTSSNSTGVDLNVNDDINADANDDANTNLDIETEYKKNYGQYDHYILINNAGSLGHLGQARTLPSPKHLQSNFELNLSSSCWLSSYFVRWFHEMNNVNDDNNDNKNVGNDMIQSNDGDNTNGDNDETNDKTKKCTVVNMSSLCAVSPFPTMAAYCAGKAYRDMYHTTLAIEEKNSGSGSENSIVKVLNYAPGAIATDMTKALSESDVLDSDLSSFFKKRDETQFVKIEDTSKKLVNLVLDGDFESGKHIDYWDEEQNESKESIE
jgi:sepiapterin reductase